MSQNELNNIEEALIKLGDLSNLDNKVAQEFLQICNKMEEMCKTLYIVPEISSQILDICSQFKSSLNKTIDINLDKVL